MTVQMANVIAIYSLHTVSRCLRECKDILSSCSSSKMSCLLWLYKKMLTLMLDVWMDFLLFSYSCRNTSAIPDPDLHLSLLYCANLCKSQIGFRHLLNSIIDKSGKRYLECNALETFQYQVILCVLDAPQSIFFITGYCECSSQFSIRGGNTIISSHGSLWILHIFGLSSRPPLASPGLRQDYALNSRSRPIQDLSYTITQDRKISHLYCISVVV